MSLLGNIKAALVNTTRDRQISVLDTADYTENITTMPIQLSRISHELSGASAIRGCLLPISITSIYYAVFCIHKTNDDGTTPLSIVSALGQIHENQAMERLIEIFIEQGIRHDLIFLRNDVKLTQSITECVEPLINAIERLTRPSCKRSLSPEFLPELNGIPESKLANLGNWYNDASINRLCAMSWQHLARRQLQKAQNIIIFPTQGLSFYRELLDHIPTLDESFIYTDNGEQLYPIAFGSRPLVDKPWRDFEILIFPVATEAIGVPGVAAAASAGGAHNHYALVILSRRPDGKYSFEYQCSLGNDPRYAPNREAAWQIFSDRCKPYDLVDPATPLVKQQFNDDDCGVWIVNNVEYILNAWISNTIPIWPTQLHIPAIRDQHQQFLKGDRPYTPKHPVAINFVPLVLFNPLDVSPSRPGSGHSSSSSSQVAVEDLQEGAAHFLFKYINKLNGLMDAPIDASTITCLQDMQHEFAREYRMAFLSESIKNEVIAKFQFYITEVSTDKLRELMRYLIQLPEQAFPKKPNIFG